MKKSQLNLKQHNRQMNDGRERTITLLNSSLRISTSHLLMLSITCPYQNTSRWEVRIDSEIHWDTSYCQKSSCYKFCRSVMWCDQCTTTYWMEYIKQRDLTIWGSPLKGIPASEPYFSIPGIVCPNIHDVTLANVSSTKNLNITKNIHDRDEQLKCTFREPIVIPE